MEERDRLTEALADRYRIEKEIGAGGMATVYLATDIRHERKVALKVLRSDLAASLGAERFLQEVRVTANLQHPHILPPDRDAMTGPWNLWGLGLTYAQLGDAEQSVEYLDQLLSNPGPESVKTLAIDPRLDRIRDHAVFRDLLERYADDVGH